MQFQAIPWKAGCRAKVDGTADAGRTGRGPGRLTNQQRYGTPSREARARLVSVFGSLSARKEPRREVAMGNTGSGRINSGLQAKAASAQRKTTLLAVAAIVVIYIILSAITEWRFLTASNMLAI